MTATVHNIPSVHEIQHAEASDTLVLKDGAEANVRDGVLELRDGEGRILLRYVDGHAEVAAPSGDLKLSAPHGRVVVEAATDVCIEAARDVIQHAGRNLSLEVEGDQSRIDMHAKGTVVATPELDVRAKETKVASGKATLIARRIAVTAGHVAQNVEHYELVADQLVEKARDSFREVSGLAQSTVGRARAIVRGIYSLRSKRSIMISKDETSIDGKRILLG